ncbi:unnamed protein product [Ceutorhynchus assimilis]|uniref:Transforming acidic coiled-coil-containing protein C-terminal domain-containing protein n=1 Tax=Ceutorhynchus assimilis TaxID=467358 RepID=A0A9N9MU49_9CUCU|nr:unnamed protein product [Ceutorhynchus assimilis]
MSVLENKENREPTKNLEDENVKEEIEKYKGEIEKLLKEGACKDQCLKNYFQKDEQFRKFVNQCKSDIKVLESKIQQQAEELSLQSRFLQTRLEQHSNAQNALSQELQKFVAIKNTIKDYQKNEKELEDKKQTLETQLNEQNAKFGSNQDNCNVEIQKIREKTNQEIEACKKEIVEVQAIYKRLQIRTSSLETSLSQKSQECQELSILYDDISKKGSLM